ncbi:MAG TPA: hypothetical protein VKG01_10090 [Thermoanaerobaculia bacterium]|nr:hypothetical protein [Thermoanaerobaculia bacterium]
MRLHRGIRQVSRMVFAAALSLAAGGAWSLLATCGPFTDVVADVFCPFVLEIFYLEITTGTTATTYDPTSNVSRLQMAAFLSRTVDRTLLRGSRRAALNQFWTVRGEVNLGVTNVGTDPFNLAADGADIWVANNVSGTVSRVRASDGLLLQTWTGAGAAFDLVAAMGHVFVTGNLTPGKLYQIDPAPAGGSVTTVATNLGGDARGITFDGARLWTANRGSSSVSIISPQPAPPYIVQTVTAGFSGPFDTLYDGTNIWITDFTAGSLLKLDGNGGVLQTVTVGAFPTSAVFDGNNIWVPNNGSNSVSVVRPATGAVLATLTGNGLNSPNTVSFDGQRVLVTNSALGFEGASIWKAADFTPIVFISTPMSSSPAGTCSDGIHFWVALASTNQIIRF